MPSVAGCKVGKPAVEVRGVAVDFRPTLCLQRARAVSCVTRGGVSGRNFAVTAGPTALTTAMSSTAVSPLESSAVSVPGFCLHPRAGRPEVGVGVVPVLCSPLCLISLHDRAGWDPQGRGE